MAFKMFLLLAATAAAVSADRPPAYGPPPSGYGPPPSYPAPAPPQYHVPERNCTVDFEKSETELCVPTLKTECSEEEVTIVAPVESEKCLQIPMVDCKAEIKTESVEICVYVYEKKDIEADAKVADVKYTKRCDTNYISMCEKKKPKYGSSYGKPEEECKEVPQETCFNKPQAESKETQVTVTIPTPVKKCETKKIQLPSISCEETTEERCFNIVELEETSVPVEKCVTSLAEPKCNKVSLQLPAQTCVEELRRYKQQYN